MLHGGAAGLGVQRADDGGDLFVGAFDLAQKLVRRHAQNAASERRELDERVARARELMLECVIGILDKVNGTDVTLIRQLIEQAFRANKQGILPTTKIFALMRMEVKDERWNKAREILQDAIKPVRGKRYLVCSVRKTTQGEFKPIYLNLNDCWPEVNGDKAE